MVSQLGHYSLVLKGQTEDRLLLCCRLLDHAMAFTTPGCSLHDVMESTAIAAFELPFSLGLEAWHQIYYERLLLH